MIDVPSIQQLHQDVVARWHEVEIDNPYEGLLEAVCTQCSYNFRLWHQEDIARSPDVGDARIAEVKRAIDKLNQARNDWIEKVDDWISEDLDARQIEADKEARLNTETPGSVIDRLAILALRIYHLEEQLQRDDADSELLDSVGRKLAICRIQQEDLGRSLGELLEDIYAGRKRHKTYRQFKMYNDPTLNPYLYQRKQAG